MKNPSSASTASVPDRVRAGLARVRDDIFRAAASIGRDAEDVRLVVVSKGRGLDEVVAVLREGVTDIGENRVAEAYRKWLALGGEGAGSDGSFPKPTFHLVGHLQRNKVPKACRFAEYLHSLDSLELAKSIAARSNRRDGGTACRMRLFVEVNVTGEPQKYGVSPDSTQDFVEMLLQEGLHPVGLMCMSRLGASPSEQRRYFETLTRLRERLADEVDRGITELSMGMSDDFEEAIRAGATMVRIGRAIFEPRTP